VTKIVVSTQKHPHNIDHAGLFILSPVILMSNSLPRSFETFDSDNLRKTTLNCAVVVFAKLHYPRISESTLSAMQTKFYLFKVGGKIVCKSTLFFPIKVLA
jgi:hypothetical protein